MFCVSKKASFVVAFTFATLLASLSGGRAATTIPFDFMSDSPSTVATVAIVTGTSGTLNFTLDLNDPDLVGVFGSFSMDIKDSSSTVIGQIGLLGATFADGPSQNFGDITKPPGASGGLPDVSTWSLTVTAGFPLSLIVTSQLNTFLDSLNPVLTLDVTDGLQVQLAATPLPGGLALFASGLGVLGWFGSRRRRARPQAAV